MGLWEFTYGVSTLRSLKPFLGPLGRGIEQREGGMSGALESGQQCLFVCVHKGVCVLVLVEFDYLRVRVCVVYMTRKTLRLISLGQA